VKVVKAAPAKKTTPTQTPAKPSSEADEREARELIDHLATCSSVRSDDRQNEVCRSYANFTYQVGSWTKSRRVIAKVECHLGELYPRVGFIVTNLAPAGRPHHHVAHTRLSFEQRTARHSWNTLTSSEISFR
jgi:hypothetical protein